MNAFAKALRSDCKNSSLSASFMAQEAPEPWFGNLTVAQIVARVGIASSIPLHGLCKLLRQNSVLTRSLRTSPRQVMRCISALCTATHACCAQPCLLHRIQIRNATDCGQ